MGCGGSNEKAPEHEPAPDDKPTEKSQSDEKIEAGASPTLYTPPAGTEYHRVTKIPIKAGSIAKIVEIAEGPAMQAHLKTFSGFLGVDTLSIDDNTFVTHSRWVSKEACEGGAAALGSVLKGFLKEFLAGPPEAPWVGPSPWSLPMGDTRKAARLTMVPLKGTESVPEVLAILKQKEPEFNQIDGLAGLFSFITPENQMVVASSWTSMEALEAAAPKIGPVMKDLAPHFGGAPVITQGSLPFSFVTEYHRVTKVPIKPGSMDELVAIAQSSEVTEHLKTFNGFLGVDAIGVGDDAMVTHSRWASREACEGGAAALGSVLKNFMGKFIAGPPAAPWAGPGVFNLPTTKSDKPQAVRCSVVPLKGMDAVGPVLSIVKAKEPDFEAIPGMLGGDGFLTPNNELVVLTNYTSMEALEGAVAQFGGIMKDMMSYFGGKPDAMHGVLKWTSGQA